MKRIMSLLKNGNQINENCVVERLIGEGAFSEVYRVRHRFLGRQAIKVLKMSCVDDADITDRLEEAALLSSLGHPNIIRVFDADTITIENEEYAYLTMEYLPAGNLEEFWRQQNMGLIPINVLINIFIQILRGLSVAHSSNPPIIHRDINLNNILLGFDGQRLRAVLCDFGFARRVNPLTLMASAKGTLPFKAPELFQNKKLDSRAADVWSVGCCMYLLLTSRFPYHVHHQMPTITVPNFPEPYTPAGKINVDVFPELEDVLFSALQINPANRIPHAMAFLGMLISCFRDLYDQQQGEEHVQIKELPPGESEAAQLVEQAEAMACFPGKLKLAADLLESAIRKDMSLKEKYSYKLSLWKKGLTA